MSRSHQQVFFGLLLFFFSAFGSAEARLEKPTITAEDFFLAIRLGDFEDAAKHLSSSDHRTVAALNANKNSQSVTLSKIIQDYFFLTQSAPAGSPMLQKAQDGETLVPTKIVFFVPGQYYIVGNYAAVFTRETYILQPDTTGPVRENPKKLWVDPTNDFSKIRDEAFTKEWWLWEDNSLTVPGIIWMVKERNQWKIDLLSGSVPKKSFAKILRWHFGRDIFEEPSGEASKTETGQTTAPAGQPANTSPTARP